MQRSLLLVSRALRSSNLMASRTCHLQKVDEISEKDLQKLIAEGFLPDEPPKRLIEPHGATEADEIAPYLKPTFNLAAYANKSPTLQKFIDMGVSLYKIEKRKGLGKFFVQLDFDKHVKNHLFFLKDVGVDPELFGEFITKNPLIFKESIEDLQTRINYLEMKKFKQADIVRIVEKNPFWLMFSTQHIDRRLGYFQKNFQLDGNQVRFLAVKQPRLITYKMDHIQHSAFTVKEEMGFTKDEMRQLLLSKPRIFMMNHESLLDRFDFAHKRMKLSLETILQSPEILTTRQFVLNQRHEFLYMLKRNQYDPKKPLYVSIRALCTTSDEEFVNNVAKSCMEEYQNFLKTL